MRSLGSTHDLSGSCAGSVGDKCAVCHMMADEVDLPPVWLELIQQRKVVHNQKLDLGKQSQAVTPLLKTNQTLNEMLVSPRSQTKPTHPLAVTRNNKPALGTKISNFPRVVLMSAFVNDIDSVTSSKNSWHGDVIVTIRYNASDFPNKKPDLYVYNGKTMAITEYRKSTENGIVSETTRMKVVMTMKGD